MTLDDSFAYLPLFAVAFLSVILIILLMAVKKKGSARISFVHYLSLSILALCCFVGALIELSSPNPEKCNGIIIAGYGMIIAAFLFIPYCLMLTTFEPKQTVKLVPKSVNRRLAEAEKQNQTQNTQNQPGPKSSYDLKMQDLSRDFMLHASAAYNSKDGLQTLLDYITKTIEEQIKADGGAVLMVDEFEDLIAVKSFDGDFPPPYKLPNDLPHKPVRIATSFKFASFQFNDNIFGEVATSGKAELIKNPNTDARIYQNGPEDFLECGSYIFVPMKIQDVVIGITAFARKHGSTPFDEDELKTVTTLSDFAAASIQSVITVNDIIDSSKVKRETEISSNIQNMLKPAKLPVIPGIQIGTLWNPVDGVCGDCYDVVVSRKDRVSFILSDIAGKGINSTIVMIMVRAMLRLVVNTRQSAGKILTWVNKGITGESFSTDHFGSAVLINYDSTLKEIQFATGGNTPVCYYDSESNTIKQISEQTEPIGVEKNTEYKDYVQKVKSGDIILSYTDGLVEALNDKGQQYSAETLLRVIAENHNASSKDLAKIVKDDVKKFSGSVSQHDDETLLLIKIL